MEGALLIIGIRLLAPLAILKWPFWGMLLAIAADASDVIIQDALGLTFLTGENYHPVDKIFDLYYLAVAAWVASKWQELRLRKIAVALFFWRFAGLLAFESTGVRQIIFFAPNIFENFYLAITGLQRFFPHIPINTTRRLWLVLFLAALPKIPQEYLMHYLEFPTWMFIKHNIFMWPN